MARTVTYNIVVGSLQQEPDEGFQGGADNKTRSSLKMILAIMPLLITRNLLAEDENKLTNCYPRSRRTGAIVRVILFQISHNGEHIS
jgi:hypothetical protein